MTKLSLYVLIIAVYAVTQGITSLLECRTYYAAKSCTTYIVSPSTAVPMHIEVKRGSSMLALWPDEFIQAEVTVEAETLLTPLA